VRAESVSQTLLGIGSRRSRWLTTLEKLGPFGEIAWKLGPFGENRIYPAPNLSPSGNFAEI
jgi:hypothetical protein